jgi:hypothetical protein
MEEYFRNFEKKMEFQEFLGVLDVFRDNETKLIK